MTPSSKKRGWIIGLGSLVVLLTCLYFWAGQRMQEFYKPIFEQEEAARQMIGKAETDLLSRIGPPQQMVTLAQLKAGTAEFPLRSYVPIPIFPVKNKVLIYLRSNLAPYIYINEQSMVEQVATAGT